MHEDSDGPLFQLLLGNFTSLMLFPHAPASYGALYDTLSDAALKLIQLAIKVSFIEDEMSIFKPINMLALSTMAITARMGGAFVALEMICAPFLHNLKLTLRQHMPILPPFQLPIYGSMMDGSQTSTRCIFQAYLEMAS